MPGFIGPGELILLGIVVLLLFGPKRLPEIGRSLGHGFREFKDSISGSGSDDNGDRMVGPPAEPVTSAGGPAGGFCHACGAELVDTARFCSACGVPVQIASSHLSR
ncbi:MAG: twin-arginine translocase TatA/TatE family subunit [Gaiellaceae bacterium]